MTFKFRRSLTLFEATFYGIGIIVGVGIIFSGAIVYHLRKNKIILAD